MPEGFDKALPGRMTRFRLSELSGVDRPAMAGARVAILKSASPPEGDGAGLPEITRRDQLQHEIATFGRHAPADRPKVKAHLVDRAKALGSTDVLPDSWATAAQEADPDSGADAEDLENVVNKLFANPTDRAIVAQVARGGQIRKSAGEAYAPGDGTAGDPDVGDIDWEQLRKANLGNIAKAAAERFKADPSKTIEKHYAEALASPSGQRAFALTV